MMIRAKPMMMMGMSTMPRLISAVILLSKFVLIVIPSVIHLVQDAIDLCNGHKDAITQGTIDLDGLVYDHSVLDLATILDTAGFNSACVGEQAHIQTIDAFPS
jgi:hypothetical protein